MSKFIDTIRDYYKNDSDRRLKTVASGYTEEGSYERAKAVLDLLIERRDKRVQLTPYQKAE